MASMGGVLLPLRRNTWNIIEYVCISDYEHRKKKKLLTSVVP